MRLFSDNLFSLIEWAHVSLLSSVRLRYLTIGENGIGAPYRVTSGEEAGLSVKVVWIELL